MASSALTAGAASGVALAADPVMANEAPDDEAVAAYEALGAAIA